MIDINKLSYEESDTDQLPIQHFYYVDFTSEEIRNFIEDLEVSDDNEEMDYLTELQATLCLYVYTEGDYKTELLITDGNGQQEWYYVDRQFDNADDLLSIIK